MPKPPSPTTASMTYFSPMVVPTMPRGSCCSILESFYLEYVTGAISLRWRDLRNRPRSSSSAVHRLGDFERRRLELLVGLPKCGRIRAPAEHRSQLCQAFPHLFEQ